MLKQSILDNDPPYFIYSMNFSSLTALELYLSGNPPVNEAIFPSQKSIYMPESFAGAPLGRAIRYCHGGYEEGFRLFMLLKHQLETANVKVNNSRRSVPALVSSRPNVPNYAAGTPKTMYRLDRAKDKKFIDVYINLAYSDETTRDPHQCGQMLLSLVRQRICPSSSGASKGIRPLQAKLGIGLRWCTPRGADQKSDGHRRQENFDPLSPGDRVEREK